jgi:hypothetical protein
MPQHLGGAFLGLGVVIPLSIALLYRITGRVDILWEMIKEARPGWLIEFSVSLKDNTGQPRIQETP